MSHPVYKYQQLFVAHCATHKSLLTLIQMFFPFRRSEAESDELKDQLSRAPRKEEVER